MMATNFRAASTSCDSESRGSERERHASRSRLLGFFLCAAFVFAGLPWTSAWAADRAIPEQSMKSLDEQVQEIKSDVLSIAAELNRLEEKLLYPSDTQVAVFVSLAEDEKARLDSVQIQIDGEPVAHHIYSFKELEALQKGGVQRVYTGNLSTGPHKLDIVVAGKGFEGSQTFEIEKAVGPKIVGLELAANDFGQAQIELGDE